jgi:hypothetical protein
MRSTTIEQEYQRQVGFVGASPSPVQIMLTLSIRNPWATLIVHHKKRLRKRCENRSWKTVPRIRNQWIAVHASGKPEQLSYGEWLNLGLFPDSVVNGAILGAMLIDHCCHITDVPKRWKNHAHTFGPVCLLISKSVRIEPVYCKGTITPMFWLAPELAAQRIMEAIACLRS